VADKHVEQEAGEDTGEDAGQGPVGEPWWAGTGSGGAVALIALGVLAAVWVFFRLPGVPQNPATGYYQAAKVAAIGLVIAGSALLGRRSRATAADDADGPNDA